MEQAQADSTDSGQLVARQAVEKHGRVGAGDGEERFAFSQTAGLTGSRWYAIRSLDWKFMWNAESGLQAASSKLRLATERREELLRQIEGEEPVFGIMGSTSRDGSAVPGQEAVLEVLGTIVEPSGLTVVSDSQFKPEKALAAKAAGGDGSAVAEFSFVEIVLAEDITVPASVVYRDKDLDLAFLKPDEKTAKQRGAKFRPCTI